MRDQPGPVYRRAAEAIKSEIASGRLSGMLTIPEAQALTGTKYATARKAVDVLAAEGILEGQPGKGYLVAVTAEEAAGAMADDRPVRDQIAELQVLTADLRQRLGRLEANLATLAGKPRGGRRDQASAAARGGRQ